MFRDFGRELRDSVLHLLREYAEALLLAVLFAFVMRSFVISTYRMPELTMEPSLRMGDFLIGYKLPYGITIPLTGIHYGQTTPRRSDLVVFHCPASTNPAKASPPTATLQLCVKRVVGIGGDSIEIRNQRLIVNGRVADYSRSRVHVSSVIRAQANVVALSEKLPGEPAYTILISNEPAPDFGPYVVPPHSFFALSDDRDFSEDSRHWGAIPDRAIEARIVLIGLSFAWRPRERGGYESHLRRHRMLLWAR